MAFDELRSIEGHYALDAPLFGSDERTSPRPWQEWSSSNLPPLGRRSVLESVSREALEATVSRLIDDGNSYSRVLATRRHAGIAFAPSTSYLVMQGGESVGICALVQHNRVDLHAAIELVLERRAWTSGVAFAAVCEVIWRAFRDTPLRTAHLELCTDESRRLEPHLSKYFRCEGRLIGDLLECGRATDRVIMSIDREGALELVASDPTLRRYFRIA